MTATEHASFPQGGYGLRLDHIQLDESSRKIIGNYLDDKYKKWKLNNSIFTQGVGVIDNTLSDNHFTCIEIPHKINIARIFIEPNYTINIINDNSNSTIIEKENVISDVCKILQQQQVLFIEGTYGCGKTILSKKIQLEYINKGFDTIYINCSEINHYVNNCDLLTEFGKRIIEDFRTLIIFDGFDELNLLAKNKENSITIFIDNIILLANRYKNIYILINTRNESVISNTFYNKLRNNHVEQRVKLKINSFTNNEIDNFLNNWRNIVEINKFFDLTSNKLRSTKTLKQACQNPLLLMWICITVQEKSWEEVQNFYSIYESFVDHTIRGKFRSPHCGIEEITNEYKIFLQVIARKIAEYYNKQLFKRKAIYEFNISDDCTYEVEINVDLNEIIKKIIDPQKLKDLSEQKLKENLLICYFLECNDNKWRFKDSNIIFFLLSEVLLSELKILSSKYKQYKARNERNINTSLHTDYLRFKDQIAPVNQISLDYILTKLKSKDSLQLKYDIFELIKYLFNNKILFNIDEKWLREFDEKRINADISISVLFMQLIENEYKAYDLSYFFKRLAWIVSAAKIININYYYLVKRFCRNAIIKNIEFRRINLSEFNFSNAIFSHVKFIQCKLFETTLDNVNINNSSEFLLCDFNKPSMNNLKGDFIFNKCNFSSFTIMNSIDANFIFNACTIKSVMFNGKYTRNTKVTLNMTTISEKLDIQIDNIANLNISQCIIKSINIKSSVAKHTQIKRNSYIECSEKMSKILLSNSEIDKSSSIKVTKGDKYN